MSDQKQKLTGIDLFSGAGGLSEGFRQAGFNFIFANDYEENSSETYRMNHPETPFIRKDIHDLTVDEVKDTISKDFDPAVIDELNVVVGGPPCQGFSTQGDMDEDDPRNKLFKEYLRIVDGFDPDFIVMENVKGILSMEDGGVKDRIIREMNDLGFNIRKPMVLNAANYGVPQSRERVFFVASRDGAPVTRPKPTHMAGNQSTLASHGQGTSSSALSVKEGISDLPLLENGGEKTEYENDPENEFQKEMRANVAKDGLTHHKSPPHRSNTVKRFELIPQGGNVKDIPDEHDDVKPDSYYYARHRKLDPDKPSYTVTSHAVSELVHYSPDQPRAVTVREAARLQSFPDNYQFAGRRVIPHKDKELSQYQQVGNAVPPKLAERIAMVLKKRLSGT